MNQGFVEMTGYPRDQVLCRTVYDIIDVLRGAERVELAKERLAEGRTIPQMEAELALPGGGTKLVIVAGQPIDMGDQPCMLFTFADLEPRRKAESALRHSEERFTRTFQMAPVPMAIGARDGHVLCEVNASFAELTDTARPRSSGARWPMSGCGRTTRRRPRSRRRSTTAGTCAVSRRGSSPRTAVAATVWCRPN